MNIDETILYKIIDIIPASVYWKDDKGRYLGCNKYVLNMAGLDNISQIIGKYDNELVWKDKANEIMENDKYVINNNTSVEFEEHTVFPDKSDHIFLTAKAPLVVNIDDQHITGLVGVSIDTTDRKEKERLQIENELQQTKISEQETFRKDVGQLVHDVSTPLATIQLVTTVYQRPNHGFL